MMKRHSSTTALCIALLLAGNIAGFGALIGHWIFEPGDETNDLTGNFPDLSLEGNATVSGGALDVNGSGTNATGWAYTTGGAGYTGPALTDKTLVSWVTLQDLGVRAGSALTIDRVNSDQFDGLIWAEMDANRWMMGSNGFSRSPGGPGNQQHFLGAANVGSTDLIQLAYTYQDTGGGNVQITGYLDGVQIGQYNDNPLGSWLPGDAEVIFGKRHGNPAVTGPGGLDALIHEARIYDTVLSEGDIRGLRMVPEPAAPMLGLLGASLFLLRRRRRR